MPPLIGMDVKLKQLRQYSNAASSIYEKTQFDYAYMSVVLKNAKDVSLYRHEIQAFQQLCLIYHCIYDDALYGQFLELLQKLMDKMD